MRSCNWFAHVCLAVSLVATSAAFGTPFAYVATVAPSNVVVIDTATNTIVATVPVTGVNHEGVAVNPAGTRVYVTNVAPGNDPGTVSVIDTATNTVIANVTV